MKKILKKKNSLKEKEIKFSESFNTKQIFNFEINEKEDIILINTEEAKNIILDIYAINYYTNYYFVWNPNINEEKINNNLNEIIEYYNEWINNKLYKEFIDKSINDNEKIIERIKKVRNSDGL
ncbi:hypothetical protein Mgra_00004637 [Meloidogyne graminicola]|uniref:Uncharacterized protein n=1 Tax=Meloidogyne graminicola TaxID=189291 RepID=A0A8S9ZSA1_9BILA|nr:hypothetical protein Mgra_00004637 [Meloidogyne graminicola]